MIKRISEKENYWCTGIYNSKVPSQHQKLSQSHLTKKLSNTLNVLCILLLTFNSLSALGHWAWIEHAYDEHDSSTFLCTFKLLLVFRACISLFLMLTLNKSLPEVTASASVKSINFRFNILLLGQKVISHPLCQNLDMRKLLVILVILK